MFLAFPFDGCFILLCELGQEFPDQVNFLFAILGHGSAERFDDIFTLFGFFIDFFKDASHVLIDIPLKDFCETFGQ